MPLLVFKIITGLCALFLGITFAQSAFVKVKDYAGNKSYFQSQFEKSPLRRFVQLLFPVITIMEGASALFCIGGIIVRVAGYYPEAIGIGLLLSALTLLGLLFGQRLANDYAGAASIAGYFIIAVFGLFAFALSI